MARDEAKVGGAALTLVSALVKILEEKGIVSTEELTEAIKYVKATVDVELALSREDGEA